MNIERTPDVSEIVDEIRDMRTPTQWALSYPEACALVEKFSTARIADEKAIALRIAKWCEELEKENDRLHKVDEDFTTQTIEAARYRAALEHIQYQCRHLPTSREEQQIGMILSNALRETARKAIE